MQYRTDPRSGNRLSVLGEGGMRLPKDYESAKRMMQTALDGGVNYIDTAYMYPGSEETFGRILADLGRRDEVYLATKLPLFLLRSGADFEKYFSRELERLRTDHIDYYLLHMLTDVPTLEKLRGWGLEDWILQKKASGQIRQFGFSFHGRQADFLALLDAWDWDCCMIQYNYSDENYQAGKAGLRAAAAKGLPVMIMEPLLGGRLADGLPEQARAAFRAVAPERSPAAWGFRWLWDQPEVTVVLSGMGHLDQVTENLRTAETAAAGLLTDPERAAYAKVAEILRASTKVPCTGCGYCLPCPKHVNIPACFSAYNAFYAIDRKTGRQQYNTSTGSFSVHRGNAGQCVRCGKCESHCPQAIPIREKLSEVQKTMEPVWWRVSMAAARKVLAFWNGKK
ncbi:MAG: aldo/keto reductase [Oscillospiraceae bacterium]|jgi:predicted aldo/keto reductase-like oxidoreductase|nr:aldo/keto reductase [Oscillospiraceae bacterium]